MLLNNYQKQYLEAGIDEAGRGCLAGPVVAAAVILPRHFQNDLLNDSKKLSIFNREALYKEIMEEAVSYGIGLVNCNEIDKINILNATYKAMHLAIGKLKPEAGFLIIDGNRFKTKLKIPYQTIVKGDGKYMGIAAASILAKVHRDNLMNKLSEKYPEYGFEKHKGYATKQHVSAINKYGYSEVHRKSFHLKQQLKLDL